MQARVPQHLAKAGRCLCRDRQPGAVIAEPQDQRRRPPEHELGTAHSHQPRRSTQARAAARQCRRKWSSARRGICGGPGNGGQAGRPEPPPTRPPRRSTTAGGRCGSIGAGKRCLRRPSARAADRTARPRRSTAPLRKCCSQWTKAAAPCRSVLGHPAYIPCGNKGARPSPPGKADRPVRPLRRRQIFAQSTATRRASPARPGHRHRQRRDNGRWRRRPRYCARARCPGAARRRNGSAPHGREPTLSRPAPPSARHHCRRR